MSNGIILFKTRALVMQADKALTGEGYTVTVVPTPRQYTGDCGIAVRFPWSYREAVTSVLKNASLEYQDIHEIKQESI